MQAAARTYRHRGKATLAAGAGDRAPDLLNRGFTVEVPNQVWGYVAFIVEVYSQRIVGWHARTSRGVELVRIPLRLAL